MSLEKIYRLRCEGPNLARRLGLGHGTQELVKVRCHQRTGSPSETSAKARQFARRAGWIRRRESLPLLDDRPEAGSTVIPFDLCPSCTDLLPEN